MRVNVIGKSNGVGLSRDLTLVADALTAAGCVVTVTKVDKAGAKRRRSTFRQWQARWRMLRTLQPARTFDANIMLEHVWPEFMHQARHNVAIPNPEWFDRHDVRFLRRVDRVWAKTRYTQQVYERLGCKVELTGFDSEDRLQAEVPRSRAFFHLAGKSTMKGTTRLLQTWAAHPGWPELTVVRHDLQAGDPQAANIRYRTGYLSEPELKRLQNEAKIHLCLSETEGWGHYILEAMSVAAVTVTVDAPPMNELLDASRGVLVAYAGSGRQKLANTFYVDTAALERAVESLLAADDAQLHSRGAAARDWFVDNKRGFAERIGTALHNLRASN